MMFDDTKKGLILIGIGFAVAVGCSLGMYGILVLKTGMVTSGIYTLIFSLIGAGVGIGTVFALIYSAMEDEWLVVGWVYMILITILGIIGLVIVGLVA